MLDIAGSVALLAVAIAAASMWAADAAQERVGSGRVVVAVVDHIVVDGC
ncbi:hypothetical protein [Dactylosporangium darangshiense]